MAVWSSMRTGGETYILILQNLSMPVKTYIHTFMLFFPKNYKYLSFLTEQTKYLKLLFEEENTKSHKFCLQQRSNIQVISLFHFSGVLFLFLFITIFHGSRQVILLSFNLSFYTCVSDGLCHSKKSGNVLEMCCKINQKEKPNNFMWHFTAVYSNNEIWVERWEISSCSCFAN